MFCEGYSNGFPEAYTENYVFGGCGVSSQKFERIQYCPICNANKKRWLKENNHLKPFPHYDIQNQFVGCQSLPPSKRNYDSLFFSPQPFGKFSKDLIYRGLKTDIIYVKKDFILNTVDSVIISKDSTCFFHRNADANISKTVKIHGRSILFIIGNLMSDVRRGTYHDPEAPEMYTIEISCYGKYVGCNDCLSIIGYEKRQIRRINWFMTLLIRQYTG